MHYETCIQSLMAQVQDLRTQNLQLQRSEQELSQAVASTAGISQSYGDRMTQIFSTLVKFDALVQGFQRDSKAVEASVFDHLKMHAAVVCDGEDVPPLLECCLIRRKSVQYSARDLGYCD